MAEAVIHDFGNEWSPEIIAALTHQYLRADNAVKAAQEERKRVSKRIQSCGIKKRNFDQMMKLKFGEDEDRETYLADLKEQRRLMQLANVPVGHQFDLVDAVEAAEPDADDVDGRAYFNGEQACLAGSDEQFDNPHNPNTAAGQEWMRGYREMETTVRVGREMLEKLEAAGMEPVPGDDGGDEEGEEADGEPEPAPKRRGRKKAGSEGDSATA